MMTGTILLAGVLTLVGVLSATYLLVQRKLQTLDDEEAFRLWFMRAFLGMRTIESQESGQGTESKGARRKGSSVKRKPRPSRPEKPDQVEAEWT